MGEAKEKVTVFTGSLKVGCYSSPWQNLIRLPTPDLREKINLELLCHKTHLLSCSDRQKYKKSVLLFPPVSRGTC